MPAAGFRHHGCQKLPGYLVLKKPFFVLGEARGVKGRIHDIEVQEPLEQQVVLEPLAELALTADRVERNQKTRLEQMLGRYRWTSQLSIHPVEGRGNFFESLVDVGFDLPDGVVLWH